MPDRDPFGFQPPRDRYREGGCSFRKRRQARGSTGRWRRSKTDRSKCSGAGLQTRCARRAPQRLLAQSTNVSELRWEIITPLRGAGRSRHLQDVREVGLDRPFLHNGSSDSPATAVHGTTAAPWAGDAALPPRAPGGRKRSPPAHRAAGERRRQGGCLGVLASSATITATPLSRTMWLSRPAGAFGSSGA